MMSHSKPIRWPGRLIAMIVAALLVSPVVLHGGTDGKALKPPTIRLRGISDVPVGEDHLRILFEATNPNEVPLPYHGYRADGFSPPLQKGVIAPLYHLEFKRNGVWKEAPIGWCGTGAGPVALVPRGKAQFAVNVPKDGWDAFKVGVDGFAPADPKGKPMIAWSDPIERAVIEKIPNKIPEDEPQPEKDADVDSVLKRIESGDRNEKLKSLGQLRIKLIAKLGDQKGRAIKLCVQRLQDKDSEISYAAYEALSWFDEDAVPPLIELLRSKNPDVEASAALLLSNISSRFPELKEKADVAIPHLAKLLKGKDKTTRHNAFHAISAMGPAAIPHLIAELEAEEYFQRVMTEGFVRHAEVAVTPLCTALRNGSVTTRRNAAYQLFHISWRAEKAGAILEKKALGSLTDAIQDKDHEVRSWANYTLGRMGYRARPALEKIVAGLARPDAPLRSIADAVAKIGAEPKHLDALLDAADRAVRAAKTENDHDNAAWWFGEALAAAGEKGVDRITRALDDPREGARMAAMWALYTLGPKASPAVPTVIRKLNDGNQHAITLLGAIGPKAKGAVPHLIRRLEKDEWLQPRTRRGLPHHSDSAHALAAIGPDAIPQLIEGLKHKNDLVAVGCVIALEEMDPKAKVPLAFIVPLSRHDNALIRLHAMLALVKHGLPKDELMPILERLQKDTSDLVAAVARKELARLQP